jgi:rubrerythrin
MNVRRRGGAPKPVINDMATLLAHALALEVEAVGRYTELAEIMASHNNREVSGLFMKMSDIETLHVEAIRDRIRDRRLKKLPVIPYQWISAEGPETTDPSDLHYLMSPHQALTLALRNEQRAHDFYQAVVDRSRDRDTRALAMELAAEEQEHVAMLQRWLVKFPATAEDWDRDDDQPNVLD